MVINSALLRWFPISNEPPLLCSFKTTVIRQIRQDYTDFKCHHFWWLPSLPMAYRDEQGMAQSWSPARPERDLPGILSLTIEAVTLIGNIFPILVVFRLKKSSERTVTDLLIGALAFTDILAVLAPLPVSLPTFIAQDNWKRGPAACHYYQFCVFWFLNVSSLLVIAMSMERVFAFAMPMRYKSWSERHRVYITIAVVYLATFLISCLPFFGLAPPVMSSRAVCKSWIAASPDVWYRSVFPMMLIVEGWTTMLLVLVLNAMLVFYLLRFTRRLKSSRTDELIRMGFKTRPRRPSEYTRCVERRPSMTKFMSRGVLSPKSAVNDKRTLSYKSKTLTRYPSSAGDTSDRRGSDRILKEIKSLNEFSKLVVVVAVMFYCTYLPVLVSFVPNYSLKIFKII